MPNKVAKDAYVGFKLPASLKEKLQSDANRSLRSLSDQLIIVLTDHYQLEPDGTPRMGTNVGTQAPQAQAAPLSTGAPLTTPAAPSEVGAKLDDPQLEPIPPAPKRYLGIIGEVKMHPNGETILSDTRVPEVDPEAWAAELVAARAGVPPSRFKHRYCGNCFADITGGIPKIGFCRHCRKIPGVRPKALPKTFAQQDVLTNKCGADLPATAHRGPSKCKTRKHVDAERCTPCIDIQLGIRGPYPGPGAPIPPRILAIQKAERAARIAQDAKRDAASAAWRATKEKAEAERMAKESNGEEKKLDSEP